MNYLSIFIAKVGMALIYFCFTCFHRVLAQSAPVLFLFFAKSCILNVHNEARWKKNSANPFYFSLIWETIFCMTINKMADILACTKKIKIKSEAIWRGKKKNVPFLLYLYISEYLLNYVILLILLTMKGFLDKNLFTCFWTLSGCLGVGSSAFCYSRICVIIKSLIKNCK